MCQNLSSFGFEHLTDSTMLQLDYLGALSHIAVIFSFFFQHKRSNKCLKVGFKSGGDWFAIPIYNSWASAVNFETFNVFFYLFWVCRLSWLICNMNEKKKAQKADIRLKNRVSAGSQLMIVTFQKALMLNQPRNKRNTLHRIKRVFFPPQFEVKTKY